MPCNMTAQSLDITSYNTGLDGRLRSNDPSGSLGGSSGGSATYLVARSQTLSANAGGQLAQSDGPIGMRLPAPAAVHFDATGFTPANSDTYPLLTHRFNFGDTGSGGEGSWTYPTADASSTRLKNEWLGSGTSAHLYETAGTFQVRHKVRQTDGVETESAITTVVVVDPDNYYSGTNTVWVYRTSGLGIGTKPDASWAEHDASTTWPTWETGKRYVLRAGEDYTSAGDININGGLHRIQVVKNGTGADPLVANIYVGYFSPDTPTEIDWPSRITFVDLNCDRFIHNNVTLYVTCVRGTIKSGTYMGSSIGFWIQPSESPPAEVLAAYTHCSFPAYFGTNISGNHVNQSSTVFGSAYGPMFVGCRAGTPTNGSGPEHTMRVFQSYKGVFQHTEMDRPHTDGRCCIRLQSNGVGTFSDSTFVGDERSQYNSIERCSLLGFTGTQFGVWAAPENDSIPQRVADVVVANNHFTGWVSGNTELGLGAENIIYTGNTFNRNPPTVLTGFKINGGIPSGPYSTDTLTYPTDFS